MPAWWPDADDVAALAQLLSEAIAPTLRKLVTKEKPRILVYASDFGAHALAIRRVFPESDLTAVFELPDDRQLLASHPVSRKMKLVDLAEYMGSGLPDTVPSEADLVVLAGQAFPSLAAPDLLTSLRGRLGPGGAVLCLEVDLAASMPPASWLKEPLVAESRKWLKPRGTAAELAKAVAGWLSTGSAGGAGKPELLSVNLAKTDAHTRRSYGALLLRTFERMAPDLLAEGKIDLASDEEFGRIVGAIDDRTMFGLQVIIAVSSKVAAAAPKAAPKGAVPPPDFIALDISDAEWKLPVPREGELGQVPLSFLRTVMKESSFNGLLRVTAWGVPGWIRFTDGNPSDAALGTTAGDAAMRNLLLYTDGTFEVIPEARGGQAAPASKLTPEPEPVPEKAAQPPPEPAPPTKKEPEFEPFPEPEGDEELVKVSAADAAPSFAVPAKSETLMDDLAATLTRGDPEPVPAKPAPASQIKDLPADALPAPAADEDVMPDDEAVPATPAPVPAEEKSAKAKPATSVLPVDFSPGDIPNSGFLQDFPISSILVHAESRMLNGKVEIQAYDSSGFLQFEDGQIVDGGFNNTRGKLAIEKIKKLSEGEYEAKWVAAAPPTPAEEPVEEPAPKAKVEEIPAAAAPIEEEVPPPAPVVEAPALPVEKKSEPEPRVEEPPPPVAETKPPPPPEPTIEEAVSEAPKAAAEAPSAAPAAPPVEIVSVEEKPGPSDAVPALQIDRQAMEGKPAAAERRVAPVEAPVPIAVGDLPAEGTLEDVPGRELLQKLSGAKFTGQLLIRQAGLNATLRFSEGRVTEAQLVNRLLEGVVEEVLSMDDGMFTVTASAAPERRAPARVGGEMPSAGEFEKTPIVDLLHIARVNRDTGVLTIKSAKGNGSIHFRAGHEFHAELEKSRGVSAIVKLLKIKAASFTWNAKGQLAAEDTLPPGYEETIWG